MRRENIKGLISHLVEEFHEQTFKEINYVDTFKQLKLKYDQQQERAAGGAGDHGARGTASATATESARELLMANRRCVSIPFQFLSLGSCWPQLSAPLCCLCRYY